MKDILNTLLFLWQLPQHIVAYFLWRAVKKHINTTLDFTAFSGYLGGVVIYVFDSEKVKWFPGVSLGRYIFISNKFTDEYMPKVKAHEWGHSVQSRILGPLYLPVIGLLSLIGNLLSHINFKIYLIYYKLPWEKWADDIGMVIRK